MKIKDRLLLTAASLALGWLLVEATTMSISSATPNNTLVIDTIKPIIYQDTIVDVKGKNVLFIGDSHTAADYGWQHQLCKKTQMRYLNTAVGGKQTGWMVEVASRSITEYFDYCFIYGGANDMAGNRPPIKSVKNIQVIVNRCLRFGVTPIVVTGFDPVTCINVEGRDIYKGYPQRYARFQQLLMDSIVGAQVVKTHCISRTDCGDFLCHMTASGHKKIAEAVILACKFKKI